MAHPVTNEFNKLYDQLGLTARALSSALSVDSKTITNWRMGRYHVNGDAIKKMKKMVSENNTKEEKPEVIEADFEEAAPATDSEESGEAEDAEDAEGAEAEELPIYARNKGVRRMIKRLKINQREFADLVGTSQAVVSGWVRNASAPSAKFHPKLREIWETAFESVPDVEKKKTGAKKGPRKGTAIVLRKPLAAAPLLEMSTEFFEMYRAERNRRDVDAILAFVSEKSGVDAATLRQLLAVILLTLKKDMDVEEIYKCLTGHK